MESISDTFYKIKCALSRIFSTILTDPIFCLLTLGSYILVVFSVTGVSGGWVDYFTQDIRNYTVQIKIGLFNAALNNSWHQAPYSACIQQIDQTLTPLQIQEHIMFCNGQLISGIMMLLSLFIAFACAVGLTMIVSSSIDQGIVLKIKPLLVGFFTLSSLLNMVSFSMGAGIMFRLIQRDFPGAYYGAGFVGSVFCWLLAAVCAAGTWYMIDINGLMKNVGFRLKEPETIPHLKDWKKYNTL